MFNNSSKMLFMTMMMMSTILVMSSNNWLTMWIGLEMNLMAFIPLISKEIKMPETKMMYFLVQSLGSMLFLMMIITNPLIMMSPVMSNKVMIITSMMSLMIKLGMAPFHMWMPEIMEKMQWMNCLLLTTWQKIAPMVIISQMNPSKEMLIFSLMSTIVSAIGGMNQTSMRKILAYSSISHSGWIMATMMSENKMWMMYFIIYSVIMLSTLMFMSQNNIMYINQTNTMNMSMYNKMMLTMSMMSMGGLPPFIGFTCKWIVIQEMIKLNQMIIITMMALSTLMTLFYYLRMISPFMMIWSSSNTWNKPKSKTKNTTIMLLNMSTMMMTFCFL